MSHLKDGLIPAKTICPFREKCDLALNGACRHSGVEHQVAFSCAVARGFDLIEESKKPLKDNK